MAKKKKKAATVWVPKMYIVVSREHYGWAASGYTSRREAAECLRDVAALGGQLGHIVELPSEEVEVK